MKMTLKESILIMFDKQRPCSYTEWKGYPIEYMPGGTPINENVETSYVTEQRQQIEQGNLVDIGSRHRHFLGYAIRDRLVAMVNYYNTIGGDWAMEANTITKQLIGLGLIEENYQPTKLGIHYYNNFEIISCSTKLLKYFRNLGDN
jgi:hypothetical protein